MEQLFGLLSFLLTLSPIIYLLVFGIRRIRLREGNSVLAIGGTSMLMGVITPIIAMILSMITVSAFSEESNESGCITYITGYIGLGIIMVVFVLPVITLVLWLVDKILRPSVLKG